MDVAVSYSTTSAKSRVIVNVGSDYLEKGL